MLTCTRSQATKSALPSSRFSPPAWNPYRQEGFPKPLLLAPKLCIYDPTVHMHLHTRHVCAYMFVHTFMHTLHKCLYMHMHLLTHAFIYTPQCPLLPKSSPATLALQLGTSAPASEKALVALGNELINKFTNCSLMQ